MGRVFRVGTRTSSLAIKQVEEVLDALRRFYPDSEINMMGFQTTGDKDRITPISEIEGTDFFTREIDGALLKREIDFAVHSAKDLPDNLIDGVVIAAITSSVDVHDALVSKGRLELDELPGGAKIGTSSSRRKMQLRKYREDFHLVDIRGNIDERLRKLYNSDLGAIVIAVAGLIRLGLVDKITQQLSLEVMQPHPLQGSLALVVRKEDLELKALLSVLDARDMRKSNTEEGGKWLYENQN